MKKFLNVSIRANMMFLKNRFLRQILGISRVLEFFSRIRCKVRKVRKERKVQPHLLATPANYLHRNRSCSLVVIKFTSTPVGSGFESQQGQVWEERDNFLPNRIRIHGGHLPNVNNLCAAAQRIGRAQRLHCQLNLST